MQDVSGSGQGIQINYNGVHLKQITVNSCCQSSDYYVCLVISYYLGYHAQQMHFLNNEWFYYISIYEMHLYIMLLPFSCERCSEFYIYILIPASIFYYLDFNFKFTCTSVICPDSSLHAKKDQKNAVDWRLDIYKIILLIWYRVTDHKLSGSKH
jgi:hypothetical protein